MSTFIVECEAHTNTILAKTKCICVSETCSSLWARDFVSVSLCLQSRFTNTKKEITLNSGRVSTVSYGTSFVTSDDTSS